MVLGKLPVPGHPTIWWGGRVVRGCWVNFQCRGVLLIWIIVGQGPIVIAIGAGGVCLDVFFSLIYHFTFLSPSLWETARYRLKYCLKGPLSPKQPTNQSYNLDDSRTRAYCAGSRCGWGCLDTFTLLCPFSPLSPSLWETARYRLKYCHKGPLNPKQPTNQLKLGLAWYRHSVLNLNSLVLKCINVSKKPIESHRE